MAEKKFNFVSPGIFLEEVDNSQLPSRDTPPGPAIIGRTEKGPGMIPVTVNSYSEYVELFGNPIPGGRGGDVFREGNYSSPTYAAYAAKAWLKNNSPATIIRLQGEHHPSRTSGDGDQNAGWDAGNVGTGTDSGGAYGLFLMNSQSNGAQTWSLAAVFYAMNDGGLVTLSGTMESGSRDTVTTTASYATSITTSTANRAAEFTALIGTRNQIRTGTGAEKIIFNFDENSDNYIRKVFNTNPTVTNSDVVSSTSTAYKNYFLGETFVRSISAEEYPGENRSKITALNDVTHGVMVGLASQGTSAQEWGDRQRPATKARTGWFIAQDVGNAGSFKPMDQQKLFRLVAREHGEWTQRNLKISIQDIKPSSNKSDPFGTFSVVIRKIDDTDKAPRFVEKFTGCSLNPNSANYVARKIGDKFSTWDTTERRYRHFGDYNNMSRYIYVDMNTEVRDGVIDPGLLPFGFFGPPKVKDVSSIVLTSDLGSAHNVFIKGSTEGTMGPDNSAEGQAYNYALWPINMTASFNFPKLPLKHTGRQNNTDKQKNQYWGIDIGKSGSAKFDPSIIDVLRPLPVALDEDDGTDATVAPEYSYVFSLDNIRDTGLAGNGLFEYISGSRASHTGQGDVGSITSMSGSSALLTGSSLGLNRFTTVFHGGCDGLDITEKDPFRNTFMSSGTEVGNYAFYSVKRAIDTIRDPEITDINLAVAPGITNTALTDHLIDTCESRADAMAIIDLAKDYVPPHENTSTETTNRPDPIGAVNTLKGRQINSSYAAAYYPFVQIRDTEADRLVYVPPSVVALGTLGSSERARDVWFAPAGFTRGGLSNGAAGIPVTGVKLQLSSEERDDLYSANVNPIASFPAEGIVVFGQKTLQVIPSALDRINVRRLLLLIKKRVSKIAATTLFEQNVQETWNNFSGQVETLLANIKGGQGLTDFKVILDETTTTPELIDRNILYAKIFLKPAQAIEFIALDFVITDSGASFAD